MKHVNVSVKIIVSAKRFPTWNPSPCIGEDSSYFKSIADTTVITCDEIKSVMDIVSTKKTKLQQQM